MRPLKKLLPIVAFALALAWVPIAWHCSWESIIGGDFFKCAPAPETGDCSSDGDDCAAVESGHYKVPDTQPSVPVPVFAMVLFQLPVLAARPSERIAPPTAAPAEISARWQFVSRTALPPRAPSFIS